MSSSDLSKALLMQHFFWYIAVLCRNATHIQCINLMAHRLLAQNDFEQCSKIWPSLSPPHKADHNLQTVQSCVSLEKTWRLHHQFQEIVLSRVQWISFVMPHTCWLLPCVSATVERCFQQLKKLRQLCGFPSPLHTE
jgi:hypothetical protein